MIYMFSKDIADNRRIVSRTSVTAQLFAGAKLSRLSTTVPNAFGARALRKIFGASSTSARPIHFLGIKIYGN